MFVAAIRRFVCSDGRRARGQVTVFTLLLTLRCRLVGGGSAKRGGMVPRAAQRAANSRKRRCIGEKILRHNGTNLTFPQVRFTNLCSVAVPIPQPRFQLWFRRFGAFSWGG